jgi:hypothetical protein
MEDVYYGADKLLDDICKNKINIKVSVEFTCTAIENIENEQKSTTEQNKENNYTREAYLAGHREAYSNFRRHIY